MNGRKVLEVSIEMAAGGEFWLDASSLSVPRLMPNLTEAIRCAHIELDFAAGRAAAKVEKFQRAASIGQAAPEVGEGSPPAPENCPDCGGPTKRGVGGVCGTCKPNHVEER